MYVYANNLALSVSENKNENMRSFRQIRPQFDAQGNVKEPLVETVAEVVLTKEGITALKNLLNDSGLVE